MTSSYPLSK
jgi:hypothetical protein